MGRLFVMLAALTAFPLWAELSATISARVPRASERPQIIDTMPDDGSIIAGAAPQIQFVFDMDMDTTRTNTRNVLLPSGMLISSLVWSDARTLDIRYTGSLDSYGAKRVDLADAYFANKEGVPIPIGGGLAFAWLNPNHPPYIIGDITATPAAPSVNQPVVFSVTTFDPDNDPLTLTWDFGDGSTGGGAGPAHTYTSEPPFLVTVTVSDGKGGTATKSLLLAGAATAPWDVAKAQISLNFKTGKDKITVLGVLTLAAGFDPSGKKVSVDFGGAAQSFTLDAKGKAKIGTDRCRLIRRLVKKQFLGGAVKVQFTLNGSFAAALADDGLTNATTPKTGTHLSVPAVLSLDGHVYEALVPVLWKAKAGTSGKGTQTTSVR